MEKNPSGTSAQVGNPVNLMKVLAIPGNACLFAMQIQGLNMIQFRSFWAAASILQRFQELPSKGYTLPSTVISILGLQIKRIEYDTSQSGRPHPSKIP